MESCVANDTVVTPAATPEPVLSPRQVEQARLLAEYELPDSSYVEERDGEVQPRTKPAATPPETPATAQPAARPRNPDGTFATAPAAAAPSKHPAYRVKAATEMGLSADEIDSYSAEDLKEVIYLNTLRKVAQREERSGQPPQSPAPAASVEPEAEPNLGLDDKGFDEDLVRIIKEQNKTIRELKSRVDEVQGFQRQRVAESIDEYADRVFTSLKDPALGEGGLAAVRQDEDALFARQMVFNRAKRLAGEDATIQQVIAQIPAAHQKIKSRFAGGAAPAAPAAAPKAPDTAAAAAWAEGGLAPTTQRRVSELPKGDARSIAGIAQYLQDNDLTDEEAADISMANLPE